MRTFLIFVLILVGLISCKTKSMATNEAPNPIVGDTVRIANKEIEYEVTIIDPGYASWLNGRALPRGYYSESYLENKNYFYITEWNRRAMQPMLFDPNLYEMQINYERQIHYGYEVNYLIYNYMVYFQNTYKQQLFGIVPPR